MVHISTYLNNGVWRLPLSNHMDVMEVRRRVVSTQIHRSDYITWDDLHPKLVKLASIWTSFRDTGQVVG